jgi:TPR repeat protein
MAHDVFISHSTKDKTAADAVCAKLEARGIRCWIAPRDILPGMSWGASIIAAIESSRVMILVLSSHANDSSQIEREVNHAASKGVLVVPLRIEDVIPGRNLEYYLGTLHWLDAITPPFHAHLDHITDTIKTWLDRLRQLEVKSPPIPAALEPLVEVNATPSATPLSPSPGSEDATANQASSAKSSLDRVTIFSGLIARLTISFRKVRAFAIHGRIPLAQKLVVGGLLAGICGLIFVIAHPGKLTPLDPNHPNEMPASSATPTSTDNLIKLRDHAMTDPEALTRLKGAADNGNATAQFFVATLYHSALMPNVTTVAKKDATAAQWYQKAADQGYAAAQSNLGFLYRDGHGVPQDYKQAAAWFQKAAAQGEPLAQANLGNFYRDGQGVPQDYKQAAAWFQKAADQGQPNAQNNLGDFYYFGQGVTQDYKQAAQWYQKAADQGYAAAQSNLGFLYRDGHGAPQDYKQAAAWFQKAAAQGSANAQDNLGKFYRHGQGVPQDYKQAAVWYQKAAAQGEPNAQASLGFLYGTGQGVPQDYKQAAQWYQKAADQGNADAQNNLGVLYLGGLGVPQDYKQAAAWFQKAAAQGSADAQYNLGIHYRDGQGVPQDYKQAAAWFRKAAAQGNVQAQKALQALPSQQ